MKIAAGTVHANLRDFAGFLLAKGGCGLDGYQG
jgi:hypothetical protein